jgi:hypothetical protein
MDGAAVEGEPAQVAACQVPRTNASVLPSGETAGVESPSEPSGGLVIRRTVPSASETSAIAGNCFSPVSTTTSDFPSRVHDTAGNGCAASAGAPPNSASFRSAPPSEGIAMYSVRPSAIRRKASLAPSGDHAGPMSLDSPLVNCKGAPAGKVRTNT